MSSDRKIRILLSTDDDGHGRGYHVVATGLRNAGIEVILGGAQRPKEIAHTAMVEGVDFIGYRIMAGEPPTLVSMLLDRIKEIGAEDIQLIVGGIISRQSALELKQMGVGEVFPPGSMIRSIVKYLKEHSRRQSAQGLEKGKEPEETP